MAENRLKREHEDREASEHTPAWRPPELLPTPDPKDGMTFRWIRVATHGESDPTNVSSKMREGWTPCKAEDHPEIFLASVEIERFADNIVMGGLMLCTAPEELAKQRKAHYRRQTANQMSTVDNNLMRESDPRMPIFKERSSQVTFGKGT
jgi:hypothetical protein